MHEMKNVWKLNCDASLKFIYCVSRLKINQESAKIMSLSSKNVFPLITITTTWILFFTQPLLQTRSLKIIHILGKWNMIINYDDYLHGLINQVILITLQGLEADAGSCPVSEPFSFRDSRVRVLVTQGAVLVLVAERDAILNLRPEPAPPRLPG